MASLAGCRAKIDRARTHIADLDAEIRHYRETEPVQIVRDADQLGQRVYRYRIADELPEPIPVIVGDAITISAPRSIISSGSCCCSIGASPRRRQCSRSAKRATNTSASHSARSGSRGRARRPAHVTRLRAFVFGGVHAPAAAPQRRILDRHAARPTPAARHDARCAALACHGFRKLCCRRYPRIDISSRRTVPMRSPDRRYRLT